MADNSTIDPGDSPSLTVATDSVTYSGDTAAVQLVKPVVVTGSEGSRVVSDFPAIVDDAAFTPATSTVMMAGFTFDDSSPDSVNEGDAGAARMSANRNVYMTIRDAAGNERGVNVNASNQLNVTGPVTNAGTFAVQVDGSALTSLQLLDDAIFTDDASFTPATSKLMVIGAQADESAPDSVDEGDAGALRMTLARGLHVNVRDDAGDSCMDGTNNALRVNVVTGGGTGGTATTDDGAFTAASGSGTPMMGFVTADSVDSGDVGVVGMLANRQLKVTLYDSGGVEAAVGGGTQYTEGGTDATITGTAILWEDTSDTLRAVSASKPLPIGDAGGSLTVDNGGTFVVQENGAALTALQLIDDTVATLGTTTYTEASTKGLVIGAVRRDADTTLVDTTNEVGPLQMDANGRLKVEAFSGETLPVSLASVPSHAVTNAGTFAVQVDGNALTALQLIDDVVFADDAAFTVASSKVAAVGFLADESSTDSVDEGDVGIARMTPDRKQIVSPQPHTAGGLSIFRTLDLDETEEEAKGTAGQVYGWYFYNASASVRYLKFYNATAASVTVGSTTPVMTFPLPAQTGGVAGNLAGTHGIAFDTAITVAATTGLADADTGAPSANDVILNLFYK